MIRRYDMSRSDNFPVCGTMETVCIKTDGEFFVYTGFPVKSAIVIPITIPQGAEIYPSDNFCHKDGFGVIFRNVPENSVIKFSYQVV